MKKALAVGIMALMAAAALVAAIPPAQAADLTPDGVWAGGAVFPLAGEAANDIYGVGVVDWELYAEGNFSVSADFLTLTGGDIGGKMALGVSANLTDAAKKGKLGAGYAPGAVDANLTKRNLISYACYRFLGTATLGLASSDEKGVAIDAGYFKEYEGPGIKATFAF